LLRAAHCRCQPLRSAGRRSEENLELKTTLERRSGGDSRESDVPQFELTFPVAPRIEASVEAGYLIEEQGGQRERGVSDVELNAKWQFLRTERSKLTLQPAVTFDTGDLGEDEHEFELGLLGSHLFGSLDLQGRIGYERRFDGEEDAIFGSVLLLFSFSDAVRVGGELAADHADSLHLRANLGVKWEVSDGIELQALIGRTIDGPV
jgi:hypothetical protein